MRKVITVLLIVVVLMATTGCVKSREVNGVEVKSYGFANKEEAVDGVKYEVSFINAFWSAISLETVVAPVLYFMFYVWVPVEVVE